MTPVVVLFGAGDRRGPRASSSAASGPPAPAGRADVDRPSASTPPTAKRRCVPWLSPSSSGWSPTGRSAPPSVPAVGWTLRSALQPTTSRRVVGRLEALATWIEALRDSVAAHRGLLAAIESTVAHAPRPAIKAHVAGLVVPHQERHRARRGPVRLRRRSSATPRPTRRSPRSSWPARFGGSDLQHLLGHRRGQHPRPDRAVATHRGGPGPTAP